MNNSRIAIASVALLAVAAHAEIISIQIDNALGGENFFFTPVWVAAHNGGFDTYNSGELASNFPGITEIAENGNTGPLSAAFAGSAAGVAGGVDTTLAGIAFDGDAPVYSPGESAVFTLDIGDSSVNRFFSYASMIVPSNDLFFANGNPTAIELFDALGNFNGPRVIEIYGRDINDNGTEVNDAAHDAAFSANDGQALPEFNPIRDFFTDPGDSGYLASFLGSGTGNGATIGSTFGPDDLVARITITQVPAPAGALTLAGAGLLCVRRRR
jgi:hypothetical protein